jgi:hypothetical protein
MRLDGLASVPARVRQKDGFPELTRRHKGLRAGAGLKCTFCSVAPQTPASARTLFLSSAHYRLERRCIDDAGDGGKMIHGIDPLSKRAELPNAFIIMFRWLMQKKV